MPVWSRDLGLTPQDMSSALRTCGLLTPENRISKYADDTYLIIGSSKRHTLRRELENVAVWASRNNLRLNPKKSREMIIARKGNAEDGHGTRFLNEDTWSARQ